MKSLVCLIALSINLNAHVIGEIFEDTVYGKAANGVKVEGGPSKTSPDRRVYKIAFSSATGAHTDIVVVSQNTGRIVSVTTNVLSIEDAVLKAAYFCEGEVSMPTKAIWGRGLILENTPGAKYKGHVFDISVEGGFTYGYRLVVACPIFWGSVSPELVEQRMEELRKAREEYFKLNKAESPKATKPQ